MATDTTTKEIRILIADDHLLFRKGLRSLLEELPGFCVVAEAGSTQEAIDAAESIKLDIVLLDISMPGRGGLEALSEITKLKPSLPVLIITMHSEDQYAIRSIKGGAAGYLTKENAPDEIERAIRKVIASGRYISPSLAEKLAIGITNQHDAPHEILSDREFEVMVKLARGWRLSDIAEQLSLSVNTISTYRSRVMIKMGFQSNADIIHYAIKTALIE